MTCREAIEFLQSYLDHELAPEQEAAFEHHLTLCESCVRYLATYKATIALGRAALADPFEQSPSSEPANPPLPLPEELVQAILSAQARTR